MSNHGKHLDAGDKFAVEYAQRYPDSEKEEAIRAFRHGWLMLFRGVGPLDAFDHATKYAHSLENDEDFHSARKDALAGYNKADEYRRLK